NGVPSTTRDQANRTHLADEKSRINGLLLTLPHSLAQARIDGQYKALLKFGDALRQQKKNLDTIEAGLAKGGRDGRPPAYLLGFDLSDIGRAIVSYGDPDTADRVVSYTPGLGTRLDNFDGDFDRAVSTWETAHDMAPGLKHASIAWLGYRPPQKSAADIVDFKTSVATKNPANAGATALASFSDALRATHVPVEQKGQHTLTMLGHSYGSLVTGLAAKQREGIADRLIFVGSPGVGVDHARELRVPRKDIWVGESTEDIVANIGSLPEDLNKVLNPEKYLSPNVNIPPNVEVSPVFGTDPGAKEFAAQRFHVEPNSKSGPHSLYWDRKSTSLRNIAEIVNGNYGKVQQAPKE
ncbi:Alpha/beta hydrolase, partial [Sinosporangium album]